MTKKYSFFDLLKGKKGKQALPFKEIVIPKIQRDYVQGAKGKNGNLNSKGKRFIEAIFEFIKDPGSGEFVLDFIYGSVKNEKFYPLDGQQRLTTLFLLYWFAAFYVFSWENTRNSYVGHLRNFSYETRTTSTDFCDFLCNFEDMDREKKPSDNIRSKRGYHNVFDFDPTIMAMLTMLDEIYGEYDKIKTSVDQDDFRKKIKKIVFYLLPMNQFGLDEELYVKMNARGKALTDYENFKADLISWMKNPNNALHTLLISPEANERPKYVNIATKLDNEWSEAVIDYAHAGDFDLAFFKFISRWFLATYLLERASGGVLSEDETIKILYFYCNAPSGENVYFRFDIFKSILENNPNTIESFFHFMNNYANNPSARGDLKAAWMADKINLAKSGDTSQRDIAIFAGISLFLNEASAFDEPLYKEWARFVLNCADGTDIDSWDSANSLIQAFKNIRSLMAVPLDIKGHMLAMSAGLPTLKAIALEKKKYDLMNTGSGFEAQIHAAEAHKFLRSDISVLLEPPSSSASLTVATLQNRIRNLEYIFDDKGLNQAGIGLNHKIIRAVIAKLPADEFLGAKLYDQTDKETQLKKALSAKKAFASTIRGFLDLPGKISIEDELNTLIKTKSVLTVPMGSRLTDARLRGAVDNLVCDNLLYGELAGKELVHMIEWSGHVCARFARGNKRSKLVEIDSDRYDLFAHLESKGFKCDPDKKIMSGGKTWYVGTEIEFHGNSPKIGHDVNVKFALDGSVEIVNDVIGRKKLHSFNYYANIHSSITTIDAELF